jgi:hypothetical protein
VRFPNDDLDEVILNKRAMTQMLVAEISITLLGLTGVALCCLKIMELVYLSDFYGSIELIMKEIWIMLHSR